MSLELNKSYTMMVISSTFKKSANFALMGGIHHIYTVTFRDVNEMDFQCEYPSKTADNTAFIPGKAACFQVLKARNYNYEIAPCQHNAGTMISGSGVQNPNAISGIPTPYAPSGGVEKPELFSSDPDIASMYMATMLFAAQIHAGIIQNPINGASDLSDVFVMANSIRDRLDKMKSKNPF